jgi:hypothetical protein
LLHLLLLDLFVKVQDYLIKERTTWIQQNFVLVLHSVFKLSSCEKLIVHYLESICLNPYLLITSNEFPFLDKDKWNNNNFEALKKTLSEFISLIRFVEISPADFFDKVRHYKAIILHYIQYMRKLWNFIWDVFPTTNILPPRVGKRVEFERRELKRKLEPEIAKSQIESQKAKRLLEHISGNFWIVLAGSNW